MPTARLIPIVLSIVFLIVPSLVQAKYTFVANERNVLYWFDQDGTPIASLPLKAAPHDIRVLPGGNLLTHQGTEIVELDASNQNVVWSFDTKALATAKKVELHSVALLPNGDFMVALSGEGKIFEINRDGQIQQQFDLKRDKPHPHRDTRLVSLVIEDDDWRYLIAQEGDGFVREYDRKGNIVWQYDVPMFGRQAKNGHGPEAFGDAVFSAIRLENGNTLIGTGNGHSVIEVTPEKEIVWKIDQNDLPEITLAWVTTLEVLDNGNIMIGNCHAGKGQPQLIEVDREKNVVWSFSDFESLGNSVSNSALLGD